MNKQATTALVNYAVANFRGFGQRGLASHGNVPGITEFGAVYNAKLDKIAAKGKLGPKGWAKLMDACPRQAQRYFAGLYTAGTGPDLTTPEGVATFVTVSQSLAREFGGRPTEQEQTLVTSLVASLGEAEETDEDEDED